MKKFLSPDFLLNTETGRQLYHDYAAGLPIIDYHCHLPPKEIAENHSFENITGIWLRGDHYKWRAMRINGIDESFITGIQIRLGKIFKVGGNSALYITQSPVSLDAP